VLVAPSGALGEASGRRVARARVSSSLASLCFALVVWVVLLAPLVALAGHVSLHGLAKALEAPGALSPLATSVEASALSLGVLVALGTPAGFLLARGKLPAPRIWEGALLAGLLLPPLVVGLLLVFLVGPLSAIGSVLERVHLSATNTFLALVIAEIYEAGPYYVLGAAAAFAGVDPELEAQAELLGDRPARAMRRVSLPLAAPGLATALAVAWARAMGAFGAVVIIAYHPFGVPMQIWTTLQENGLAAALPYALVLLVVALPLPLGAFWWSARARRRAAG
jgi:molybdate/tungstate transport system permease protein